VTTRRAVIAGTLALLAWPPAAEAQTAAKVYRVGLLGGSTPTSPEASHVWEGFFQGLRDRGYVVGENIVVEGRFYEDRIDRLPSLAAELVRLQVDVIVAGRTPRPGRPSAPRPRSPS
jgi:putative ABC transport system substrate-binding protein